MAHGPNLAHSLFCTACELIMLVFIFFNGWKQILKNHFQWHENDIKFLLCVLSGEGSRSPALEYIILRPVWTHAAQTQSVSPLEAKYGSSILSIKPAFDGYWLWDCPKHRKWFLSSYPLRSGHLKSVSYGGPFLELNLMT